ncbi:hypothetical protein Pint_26843 [Pistacia integerrima]|uniref:Uncharacterized protein n=1 Tax=Pistacia integerrima TaxID=434235 RepID=A0ACC0YPT2_9ROSI|nr:hypothetical protein Pint_26843 [Pistacia integerrima]
MQQGLSKAVAARTMKKSDHFIDHLISRLHSAHKSRYLNFPTATIEEKPALPVCRSHSSLDYKKPEAVSHVSAPSLAADQCPQLRYLVELGMDLEQIKLATLRYPSFANYILERKIKPLVEFLLDLGVAKSEIPKILVRRPHLCGHSISGKMMPIMLYLKDMRVDKQWAKVIFLLPRTPQSQQAEGSGNC